MLSSPTVPALHYHSEAGLTRTAQLFLQRDVAVVAESVAGTLDLTHLEWHKVPRRVEVVGTLDKLMARGAGV